MSDPAALNACGTLQSLEPAGHNQPLAPSASASARLLNELVADALRYRGSKEYARLLRFIRGFRSYKPFNALLVDVQKPGSRYVAPAGRWRADYGHRIRVGAQPIVILQPFGPVMFVFDVSDVEPDGDAGPLPLGVTDPFAVLTATPDRAVDAANARLIDNCVRDGVRTTEVAFGAGLAGRIGRARSEGSLSFRNPARKEPAHVPVPLRYDLQINRAQQGLTRYATLAHELGHLYCGHVGTPNEKWWPDQRNKDQRTAEFEAESVAAIALGRLDPTAQMPPYLAQHLKQEAQVPEGLNLERVMQAAGLVIEMTEKSMKPRT